ncbi:PilZ domain-containing protein [soil metagenome]
MNEYRRATRRKADQGIEVLDTMTEKVVGHMSDLSETGMLLIAHQRMASDALYQLRFRLVGPRGGGEHAVEVGAHELWSDDAAAPGQIWTGFRFIDISAQDLVFVRNWVAAGVDP